MVLFFFVEWEGLVLDSCHDHQVLVSSLSFLIFSLYLSLCFSYYIPEDGDSPEHPNFFICDSNSLTVGQLKKV